MPILPIYPFLRAPTTVQPGEHFLVRRNRTARLPGTAVAALGGVVHVAPFPRHELDLAAETLSHA